MRTTQTDRQAQEAQDKDEVFDSILPLPFRLLLIISFTLSSWATTLLVLGYRHLNPARLLSSNHPSASSSSSHPSRLYQPVYYASTSLAILTVLGLLFHRLTVTLELLPSPYALIISTLPSLLLLAVPFRLAPFSNQFRTVHRRLYRTLTRIIEPSLIPQSTTLFSDIIFADLLTSLSRPLGDLGSFISTILCLNPKLQSTVSIAFNCLPYLIRFKQCINDVLVGPSKLKSTMNAIKYSSGIPMIILNSRLMRSSNEEERRRYLLSWMVVCLINSIYSSWWDIVNDWGISRREILKWYHLSNSSDHHHHHHHHNNNNNTQNKRYVNQTPSVLPISQHSNNKSLPGHRILFDQGTWWAYLILIIINIILRMTWTIGIFVKPPKMIGLRLYFSLELIEIIRRSIWCLVRLEWEEITRRRSNDYYLDLTDDIDQLLEFDDEDEEEEEHDREGFDNQDHPAQIHQVELERINEEQNDDYETRLRHEPIISDHHRHHHHYYHHQLSLEEKKNKKHNGLSEDPNYQPECLETRDLKILNPTSNTTTTSPPNRLQHQHHHHQVILSPSNSQLNQSSQSSLSLHSPASKPRSSSFKLSSS